MVVEAAEGEITIESALAYRARASASAGAAVGLVFLPLGVLLAVLSRTFGWLAVFELWAVLVGVVSFLGQRQNRVFVGPAGVRRVAQHCDLIASWPSLERVEVKTPGNRAVALTVVSSALEVRSQRRNGISHDAKAMMRHPPKGFTVRLAREAADQLVAEVAQRRPGLAGLSDWSVRSRPAPSARG